MRQPREGELIELYKISREEAYHHSSINMQIYMANGIVVSLLLVFIGLAFTDDLRQPRWTPFVKGGILAFFTAVQLYFYWAIDRIKRIFDASDKVCTEIEAQLGTHLADVDRLMVSRPAGEEKRG